jgi:hypothetical protein
MKWIDKRYYNIYLVGAIITACFVFMFASTAAVMSDIGGKTSNDLALEKAQKDCDKKNGTLVQLTKNNPLNTACIVDTGKE